MSKTIPLVEIIINKEIYFLYYNFGTDWNRLEDLEAGNLVDWFFMILNYLDKQKKSDSKRKWKKLTKIFRGNPGNVLKAVEYFNDFLTTYDFKQELLNFTTSFIPDFENIYILRT